MSAADIQAARHSLASLLADAEAHKARLQGDAQDKTRPSIRTWEKWRVWDHRAYLLGRLLQELERWAE